MRKPRVAWGITGAGDLLPESLEEMRSYLGRLDITVLVSQNAEIVLKWYKLWKVVKEGFPRVKVERGPNQPFVAGALQVGYYSLLWISPATANTTAKIAVGIADTLITNCVSQAIKGGTPVFIYPVDQNPGSVTTEIPGGTRIQIKTRQVDLDNVSRLRRMEGITVLGHPRDIRPHLESLL